MNISFLLAFWGGVISFFSPCILPLVPVYLSYISGVSLQEMTSSRRTLIIKVLIFVLGFSIFFSLLGASASFLGSWLFVYRDLLSRIGGVILIIFGISFLGLMRIPFLYREARINLKGTGGYLGAFLLGLVFAVGWTPCVTPILSSIFLYATREESVYRGILLLFFYALGIGVPFFLVALFIDVFLKNTNRIRRILPYVSYISGIFLILMGVFLLFGKMFSQIFFS
ncbi:sulfite exporter TauE/SafE family protein [bacterium]|nr:sulfite exporter TauE/SafE family protein [bacterium]